MSNCWVTKYVGINGWTFRVDTILCDVIDAEISNRIHIFESSKGLLCLSKHYTYINSKKNNTLKNFIF